MITVSNIFFCLTEIQTQDSQPVYAEIQKISKPEQSSSVESLDQLRILPTSGDDDDDYSDEGATTSSSLSATKILRTP